MKVKNLIKQLQQTDEENTVVIDGVDFTGVGFDDNNDVELYIACGDKNY